MGPRHNPGIEKETEPTLEKQVDAAIQPVELEKVMGEEEEVGTAAVLAFLAEFPGYGYEGTIDQLRREEFSRLDKGPARQVYLDHAGNMLSCSLALALLPFYPLALCPLILSPSCPPTLSSSSPLLML
jgi:hypothetical protein